MNDFTKEELEKIEAALSNYSYSDPLGDKIQSMIDNYCEHQSDGKDYCPGLYDKVCNGDDILAVDLNRVKKCVKCYRYFE